MTLDPIQYVLGAFSGGLVGLALGLFGGGGSILAVPLMAYIVGVPNPHLAIGTSAFAVAANALANLVGHARLGHVKWGCAIIYSLAGIAGALIGSTVGKLLDGQHLLLAFAFLMILVGVLMLKRRTIQGDAGAHCSRANAPKVIAFGGLTGILSGFFGIGGGFLIVPGLMASTGMPILFAVGSSLVAVAAFGLTTAVNYAWSGFVDWTLATVFIGGGVVGGLLGAVVASRLAARKGALNVMFALMILVVAAYMLYRGLTQIIAA